MNTDLPVPIYKSTSPKRSNEENLLSITASSYLSQSSNFNVPKPERPHHHHRPHLHRHHKEGKEKDAGLGVLIRKEFESEFVTPEESRNPSRSTSFLENGGGKYEVDGLILAPSWKEERRVVKDVEVTSEKERSVLQATELRNMLNNLNTLSNNTTRRLDNTYYSVLEKLSTLQSTITSLKELATMTRGLNEEFKQEAEAVVVEVQTSVDGYEGFGEQGKRIEGLADRVRKGREKIKTLGERVEVVREQVDGWEKAEGEWRERTRKRLKVLWMVIAVCGFVILGLLAFQYALARTQGPAVIKGMTAREFGEALPDLEKIRNETWTLKRSTEDALEKMKAKSREKEEQEEDPRLRIFDEL
jgi:hypothetical protein